MDADKQPWETTYPNRRWEERWSIVSWRGWRIERDADYRIDPMISQGANDEAPDSIKISCLNGGMSVIFTSSPLSVFEYVLKALFTDISSLAVKRSSTIWGQCAV